MRQTSAAGFLKDGNYFFPWKFLGENAFNYMRSILLRLYYYYCYTDETMVDYYEGTTLTPDRSFVIMT